jgi:hypothetical protein
MTYALGAKFPVSDKPATCDDAPMLFGIAGPGVHATAPTTPETQSMRSAAAD